MGHVNVASGIDARFCPANIEGVCDECSQYSPYCIIRWFGVVGRMICRKCRLP